MIILKFELVIFCKLFKLPPFWGKKLYQQYSCRQTFVTFIHSIVKYKILKHRSKFQWLNGCVTFLYRTLEGLNRYLITRNVAVPFFHFIINIGRILNNDIFKLQVKNSFLIFFKRVRSSAGLLLLDHLHDTKHIRPWNFEIVVNRLNSDDYYTHNWMKNIHNLKGSNLFSFSLLQCGLA